MSTLSFLMGKSKKIVAALLISLTFALPLWATSQNDCEAFVDKDNPLITRHIAQKIIKEKIEAVRLKSKYTIEKAKGVVGEEIAREEIEKSSIYGINYVSIFNLFDCNIKNILHNKSDNGIDDVFVVLNKDGTINRNHNPLFHEAKYDGRCSLKLKPTKKICQQLSFKWLDNNIKVAYDRVSIRFDDHNEFNITLCNLKERKRLQADLKWLKEKLYNGSFYRTASILCANGNFKVYPVY